MQRTAFTRHCRVGAQGAEKTARKEDKKALKQLRKEHGEADIDDILQEYKYARTLLPA